VAILWPRQSSMVSVRAGQVATLMPVTVAGASRFPPGTRPASAAAGAAAGSISGLVTGHGRPLRGVCVEAQPLGGGPRDFARTSRSGRYRIRNLPPHRYRVNFASLDCAATSNWLSQWYPGINAPNAPSNAKIIKLRAGANLSGIDGKLTGSAAPARPGSPSMIPLHRCSSSGSAPEAAPGTSTLLRG
jgi:hypothetical protein